MDPETVRAERDALVERLGPWTAHNVRLADGVFTLSERPSGDEVKLRRVTQIVSDLYAGALDGVRVLDLACLEGMYTLELAARGADAVGLEGREANVGKARFAARTLGLDRARFVQDDVRNLSPEAHGEFDVVLALGILYHLDAPDLFDVIERIAAVCRRALVVDTAVALSPNETQERDGESYEAVRLVEHRPDASEEERQAAVWSSLDNETAVALSRPSLERLLARSGFTSVYECHVPAEPNKQLARVTLLALKGAPVGGLLSPPPDEDAAAVPERAALGRRLQAGRLWALGRLLPPPLRARLRRLLGVETQRY